MRDLILIVHISLDGFVAGLNGELDGFPSGDENLAFVNSLTEGADAAIMGRTSYQLLNQFWPGAKDRPEATKAEIEYSTWYNEAQKIVVSDSMSEPGIERTTLLHDVTSETIDCLKREPGGNILIFGSPTLAHHLMQFDLIDGYWVFVNPVIFGEGIPLFRSTKQRPKLRLKDTKQFANGEVGLHYEVE